MRLNELREAVGYLDASQRRGDCQTWPLDPMLTVARRLLALFDDCDHDEGRYREEDCPYCDHGNSPQIPSEEFSTLWAVSSLYYAQSAAQALAGFLFDEER